MKKFLFLLLIIHCSLIITNAQWVQMSNGMGNLYITSLAYAGNNIFAGSTNGITGVYLSTNNGTNWTLTSLNNNQIISLTVNGNNIFAGSGTSGTNGVYLSTNNGTSWFLNSLNNRSVLALAKSGNNVFAGTNSDGVFLSTNNGGNWNQTTLNNRTIRSLAAKGDTIFAGTGTGVYGLYLSTNNGTTWTQTSLNNRNIYSIAINENNVFAGTNAYGVYLSTNYGATWTQTPFNNQDIEALSVSGNYVFAGTALNGVYVSSDNGATWIQWNEGGLQFAYVRTLCIINNYKFAGVYNGGVWRRPLSELVGIQPISTEIPKLFSLSQNYPNPFNPSTKIQFALPKSSFATVIVYDILGNEVATLVKEQLNPGSYEVDWDGTNYSSGVYYYKLTSGDFSETRKAVLIK